MNRSVMPGERATVKPHTQGVLQRKCSACGSHTVAGASCTRCAKGASSAPQAAAPPRREALEQEADRFADAAAKPAAGSPVLSLGAAQQLQASPNPLLRATIAAGVSTPHEAAPARALAPSAAPLAAGAVRVHRNAQANAAARLAGAHAYAYGAHIVLGAPASDLDSAFGRRIFAHEFAHVGQQTAFRGEAPAPQAQFSLKSYVAAMNQKPEPDWKTAAEHLNGETPATIRIILKNLPAQFRAKLHEAAREWPGLCSNIGRMTEADYLKEHPATVERADSACAAAEPAAAPAAASKQPAQPEPASAPAAAAASAELTDADAQPCSPLYRQKLCVHIIGGFNGDRSGVETPEEMARYNLSCRAESEYAGPDVGLSEAERLALRTPKCPRGDPGSARERARAARIAEVLKRSAKYGDIGEELVRILNDPAFQISLAIGIAGYLGLWVVPEPLISKFIAALTTIAILSTGAFSVSMIYNLAQAWLTLESEADAAQSDEALELAAEHFGRRITAAEADLLVFLASILVAKVIPGPRRLPPPGKALADAERAMAATKLGDNVIQGPWGRVRAVEPGGGAGAASRPMVQGTSAIKVESAAAPAPARRVQLAPNEMPLPANDMPLPANDNAVALSPAAAAPKSTVVVVPGVAPAPAPATPAKKTRPPFVLRLPLQKGPHLPTYKRWLGVLQSDPNYVRGNPNQLERWHQALRIGGGDGIPSYVYERGHRLGFSGEDGERLIRAPNWSRTRSVPMEVDHIVELQVTPDSMRSHFNSIDNYELLDRGANGTSGPLLAAKIAAERAIQVAFDPTAANRVLRFDQVVIDGGSPGERWVPDELRAGRQLDAYLKNRK